MDYINSKRMPVDLKDHVCSEVTYEVDGLKLKGLLLAPQREVARIVVYLRGGKGQVGRVRTARLLQFSDPHTLVFAPYYRGNNGSEGKDQFCGDDLHDVTVALNQLRASYPETPIHMIGFSRGGIQGLLTFQHLPVTSFIIWDGVTDLRMMYEERVDLRGMMRRMIGHPRKHPEAYRDRDALSQLHQQSPPILIVHGGADRQVGIQQAHHLEGVLRRVGATYETWYQPTEGHVPRPPYMRATLTHIHDWMTRVEQGQLSK
ncbi:prolyl oligopeptidase family serine peptidase [Staphylococcus pettenkoferi]|uniref:alpha/beta hydrolase family protein n=1 Tax=Staphylococcus pettenkoferi TaxID=170573 RepID=UPI002275CA98|nr:prolyl oligopeptidase family serine peptidase [Staphylococcus pettenkoferi]MCY1568493.1 prolyl oligopeptidase family serine peptidase [Staphylococcus pettenkoferi]